MSNLKKENIFHEKLYHSYFQSFAKNKILYENITDHQELIIFENDTFGKIMVLDGIIQTTQKDEFIYHEMMVHIPLFAHPNPKKVLIIGGGDGGILREVIKHPNIENISMVEIDEEVVNFSKQHFPNHSKGAFEDNRFKLIIDDGSLFVKNTTEKFDVIICDSTDPIGPGEVLFTQEFYQNISNILNDTGMFVGQNGVAFLQQQEFINTHNRMQKYFTSKGFYCVAVPTYVGGVMLLSFGIKGEIDSQLNVIRQKYAQSKIDTDYYNPEIHVASFALPNYVKKKLEKI